MKVNISKFPKKTTEERKVSVQFHDHDFWNLDHTLALIIHPALIKFKKHRTGYASGLDPNTPCDGDGGCMKCKCPDIYVEYLDKMIWSFGEIVKNSALTDKPKGMSYKEYTDKVQEGLDLFAKYYMSLWT